MAEGSLTRGLGLQFAEMIHISGCRCRDVQNRRRFRPPQQQEFVEGELVVHLSSDNNDDEEENEEGEDEGRQSPPPRLPSVEQSAQG